MNCFTEALLAQCHEEKGESLMQILSATFCGLSASNFNTKRVTVSSIIFFSVYSLQEAREVVCMGIDAVIVQGI